MISPKLVRMLSLLSWLLNKCQYKPYTVIFFNGIIAGGRFLNRSLKSSGSCFQNCRGLRKAIGSRNGLSIFAVKLLLHNARVGKPYKEHATYLEMVQVTCLFFENLFYTDMICCMYVMIVKWLAMDFFPMDLMRKCESDELAIGGLLNHASVVCWSIIFYWCILGWGFPHPSKSGHVPRYSFFRHGV